MKKFISFLAILMVVIATFTSCKETQKFRWDVNAEAVGDGYVSVIYPTGNFVAKGNALVTANSAYEFSLLKTANVPLCGDVLAHPNNYTKDVVTLANEVNSAFYVDSISGRYCVRLWGLVGYGDVVIAFDEKYPKDSTQYSQNRSAAQKEILEKPLIE